SLINTPQQAAGRLHSGAVSTCFGRTKWVAYAVSILGSPDLENCRSVQIPPDLVVKSQPTDIVDIVLQLIRRPNGAHRACHSKKSRGEPFSTSEVQWSTTKSDGVCNIKVLDPRFQKYMLGNAAIERIAGGCSFTEGPVWP